MSDPKVSIIILNWNGEEKLRETLASIIDIEYPNYEVIFVDNNSSDDSVAIAHEILSDIDYQVVENEENYGYSKGKNIGAAHATGEYLWLLDNDIIVEPSALGTLVSRVSSDVLCGGAVPAIRFRCEGTEFDGKYSAGQFYEFPFNPYYDLVTELPDVSEISVSILAGGALFIPREQWDRLGGYDEACEMKLDQTDISMKLWITGKECKLFTGAVVTHLGRPGGNVQDYNWYNYNYTKGRYRLMLKNYQLTNLIIALPLFFIWSIISTGRWICMDRAVSPAFRGWLRAHSNLIKEWKDISNRRNNIQAMRNSPDSDFFREPVDHE